jgi:poly-beta-1,6-N-acetyl-D-glucosamine biosynthesis protein PgaD
MKHTPLIIYKSTQSSLLKLRDVLLTTLCWGLWCMVLASIYWGDGFHLSSTYLALVLMLSITFILWSGLHYLWSPIRNKNKVPPLSLKKLARHFNMHSDLVHSLQHEKQVVLELSAKGSLLKLESVSA